MTIGNDSDRLRELWQRQPDSPFSMNPDEIRKKLHQFQRKLRGRTIVVSIICLAETLCFAYWLIFSTQPVIIRIAFLLIILAMNFVAGQVWLDERDRRKAMEGVDAPVQPNCLDFYRTELVRQRNFHRGVWFWSRMIALLPGLLIIGAWAAIKLPGTRDGYIGDSILVVTFIISLVAVWLNRRMSQKYRRRIEAIDAMK